MGYNQEFENATTQCQNIIKCRKGSPTSSSLGHLQIKIDMIRISNTTCCHTLDTKFKNIDFEGTESFPKFGFERIAISDLKNIKHNLLQLMNF